MMGCEVFVVDADVYDKPNFITKSYFLSKNGSEENVTTFFLQNSQTPKKHKSRPKKKNVGTQVKAADLQRQAKKKKTDETEIELYWVNANFNSNSTAAL